MPDPRPKNGKSESEPPPLRSFGRRRGRKLTQRQAGLLEDRLAAVAMRYWGWDGEFSRSWPIGTTALWIAILLSAYVLIYYLA